MRRSLVLTTRVYILIGTESRRAGRQIRPIRKGEMTRTYYEGMEDQLSALELVLNCTVLWNTFYANRALE
ncbi:Tn3 family transposase [Nocardia anaemiae]|uniref:Tn3 family transposase n=1 Tax=Nocardia anaemiae TaxID=263910 RepID=UPI0035311F34